LFVAAVGQASAQSCTGDCDAGQSVGVAELVSGVNIALGSGDLSDCQRMDRSGDGRIAVDELVEAVANSVSGCPSQRVARASSSVALSSVRTVLNFGSIAAGGGGGGAGMSAAPANPFESLQGGGQGFGCETVFCALGGTEQTCCFFDEIEFIDVVEITRDQCAFFVDEFETTTVTFDGFVSLASLDGDFDPCFDRLPPFGSSFRMEFDGFTGLVQDSSGNFDLTLSTYTEQFEGFGTSCFPSQFDPFAFGIRGDGLRTLDGSVQRIIGDTFNGPTFDSTAFAEGLELDVILSQDFNDCGVVTDIDGRVSGSDAVTGVQSEQTYELFSVFQTPGDNGTFFLDFEGGLITDCVGSISVGTEESLELPFGAVCPVAGQVLISSDDESVTTAIGYTAGGGIIIDVGDDGRIEDARDSCIDLDLRECGMQQQDQTCAPCSGSCGAGFECAECVLCELADSRCVPAGEFAFCGDDLYGSLFIEF
jgi:hypothetical protein